MNQSAILATALIVGFGLFLASRDRLSLYARVLWGEKPETHSEPEGPQAKEDKGFDPLDPLGSVEKSIDQWWADKWNDVIGQDGGE